jgi:hypothetical protein
LEPALAGLEAGTAALPRAASSGFNLKLTDGWTSIGFALASRADVQYASVAAACDAGAYATTAPDWALAAPATAADKATAVTTPPAMRRQKKRGFISTSS